MFGNKRTNNLLIVVLAVLIAAGSFSVLQSKSVKDVYSEVRYNITIFGQIYKALNERYIKEIDPEKFMRAGIEGMLNELDPYTVYLEKDGQDEIQIMTRGKYYGVGMRIVVRNGWATVADTPFPNSPAYRAGIREGDQIIEIDGESTKRFTLSETASRLRGDKKGSEVRIKILRIGEPEPLSFTLIRDEIIVTDINFSGFVEPGIGLIDLSQFNRGAGQQVGDAIEQLKDQGLDALILDLRGNPGGLLDVAVSVADCFVPKGELVVYTKGRTAETMQEYRAQRIPEAGEIPVAVLIDGYSASASEIVAGAIQDHDRGIVIGRPSYGKGLVQTVLPLDRRGESQIKLTTAAYYLPSGRLIQKPDIFKSGPESVFYSDEQNKALKDKKYYTKNGRLVQGAGGIYPDIEVENQPTTPYVIEMLRRSLFFNYSLNYVAAHKDLQPGFEVTDEMLADFMEFVESKDFQYKPMGYAQLEELEKIAKENEFYDQMASGIDGLKSQFEQVSLQDREKSMDQIKLILKREITAKLFGHEAAARVLFPSDSTLMTAVNILKDREKYNKILSGQVALNK